MAEAHALTPSIAPRPVAATPSDSDRIEPRRLLAFLAMVFGMFMAILDIQIVSASLTEIQAGLAASADEIPWVQTAYLIAEVVMIPLSGYLSRALGTRLVFAISAAGFTAASFLCGTASSIGETIGTLALIDFDQPNLALFKRFDWVGLLAMAGFLGSLEYVLEDGPRYDWLDDDSIFVFAWISAISAVVFFSRVLTAEQQIVDLRSFANRNFALGSLFSFVLGIGLYGLTLVYPLYLGRVRGYDALMIGETMFVSGLAMLLTAPLAGRLVAKVDQRLMLMFGFLCFAVGTWWMTYLTKDWDFQELLWPQIFRGVGLMFAIIPINNIALGTLSQDRVKNASGLYNLMRNLGGAVGLAAIYTFLNDRTDLHLARLHEALNSAYRPALETLDNLTSHFQAYGADAKMMALKQLYMMAHREGVVMAFSDVFLALTVLFVVVGLGTIIMKRPAAATAPGD